MKKVLPFLFLISGLLSCNNSSVPDQALLQQNMQDSLWQDAMAIHDDVMPKMANINKLSRELRALLEKEDSLSDDQKEWIRLQVDALENADEGMMEWMARISENQLPMLRKKLPHDSIVMFIKKETVAIIKVRQDMLNSITKADSLLNALSLSEEN